MPTVAFASSKGGAGKTTSAILLATELKAAGTTVAVIDADPAARLLKWSERAETKNPVHVIKSNGEKAILDEIEALSSEYAFVPIDREGSASRLSSYAIGESDLVIVPSGEEQQGTEEAIATLTEVEREGRTRRRTISAVVLFCRTNAAVKSKLEKHINKEVSAATKVLETQLHRRTAFSSLHNYGGGLRDLDPNDVNGIDKAIQKAEQFAAEVVDLLKEGQNE